LPRRAFFAMPSAMRDLISLGACALLCACSRSPAEHEVSRREPLPPPPGAIADAGAWASRVGQPSVPSAHPRAGAKASALRAAVMSDEVEASDDEVFVSRLVYRLRFEVPPAMRDKRGVISAPAGELQLDVSMNRLRARLLGPGWPVDEGAEIRLRADLPGAYLFDGAGGRSLGGGQLASWFEGRASGAAQTRVAVRREYGRPSERPVPGDMVCALIAEWGGYSRASLDYRCNEEFLPPGFRVGPWVGELTAVVPMELPRRALRADETDPPPAIAARPARALLDPEAVGKLIPSRPSDEAGPAALTIDNHTDTRAIVVVQGVAVGWINAGERLRIEGFAPGDYRVGAIRPLGILRMPVRLVRIPGELVIGRSED
jgi:hypothetical protein